MRGRYTYPKHLTGEWDFNSNASPKINMFSFLQGYRTYILVAIGAIVWGAAALGYIPQEVAVHAYQLLGLGAAGTIRAAIKK